VNSSTTARGSAAEAGRTTATIAQTPKVPNAPDHREIELQAIITVILKDREIRVANSRREHPTEHKANRLSDRAEAAFI
jgi:hypothetical protein